jgi:outer membrane protein OmpA-like peptidoglycan-associated protein
VVDSLDKCVDIPGMVSTDPALNGCPDRDGDGITDADDRCPDTKGTKDLFGCLDSDSDGVIDPEDKCPDVKGVTASAGCPEDTTQKGGTREAPVPVVQPVYFTTASAELSAEAKAILDNAADLLKANKGYQLEINGHTDNTGTERNNESLSATRAKNVRAYLLNKGVSSKQLRYAGFADKQPAASNDDESTRKLNRRVEFNLITK